MRYEVRGCWETDGFITSWPLAQEPVEPFEFFGVYENLPDGTQRHVIDRPTVKEAEDVADWLERAPAGVSNITIITEEDS